MAVANEKQALFSGSQADTLRLIVYLIAAVVLMVTDYRSGYLQQLRAWSGAIVVPLYRIAQAPVDGFRWLYEAGGERVTLKRENDALRAELLLAQARLNAAWLEAERSHAASGLADAAGRHGLTGRMVDVFDIDLDPYRHRVVLDAGSATGVRVGQPVIDAWGLVGQVTATTGGTGTVLLLTDPTHAVPVRNGRTGQRAVAQGIGRDDRVLVPNLPLNSDLREGDELLSSGLGGRFPAGFPVAVVREIGTDANGAFAQALAEPLAQLRLSRQLLLLSESPVTSVDEGWPSDGVGPPQPVPAQDPASTP